MNNQDIKRKFNVEKTSRLAMAILLDALGMATYFVPALGEFGDLALAPITSFAVYMLFGKKFKFATLNFVEELVPFTDIVPSATIAWYWRYVKNEMETLNEFVDKENKKNRIFDNYIS